MSRDVEAWLFGSDVPSVRALPHMGARATEFAANVQGPNGERLVVKPSVVSRIVSAFKRDNGDEVEKLRRMLAKVNAE